LAGTLKSKVACATATSRNMVVVAGGAKLYYEQVVRGVVAKIGFDSYMDNLSSIAKVCGLHQRTKSSYRWWCSSKQV